MALRRGCAASQHLLLSAVVCLVACSVNAGGQSSASSAPAQSDLAATLERVLAWTPELPRSVLARGTARQGNTARVQEAVARIVRGERVKIALMGGSLSLRGVNQPDESFMHQVHKWLELTFVAGCRDEAAADYQKLADRPPNPRIWQSRTCAAAQKRHLHRPARSRAAAPRPRLGTNLSGPYPNVTHGSGQVHVYDNPCFVLFTSCSNVTDDRSRLVFANAIESKPDGWPCFELLSPLEPVLDRVLEGDCSSPHCSATTEADSIPDLVDVDTSDDDSMPGLAEMSDDNSDDDLPQKQSSEGQAAAALRKQEADASEANGKPPPRPGPFSRDARADMEGGADLQSASSERYLKTGQLCSGSHIEYLSLAVGAAGPGFIEKCQLQHLPEDVDLVVLDFGVNDGVDQNHLSHPERHAYERILRHALTRERAPAVIGFEAFSWAHASGSFYGDGGKGETGRLSQDKHGLLDEWYGDVQMLSVRAALFPVLAASDDPLRLVYVDKNGPSDFIHVSLIGHRWYADLIIEYLATISEVVLSRMLAAKAFEALGSPAAGAAMRVLSQLPGGGAAEGEPGDACIVPGSRGVDFASECAPLLPSLPPPFFVGNEVHPFGVCAVGVDFGAMASGWDWVDEGKPGAPKWGYVSSTPGETLTIRVPLDGDALLAAHLVERGGAEFKDPKGKEAKKDRRMAAWLIYMESYEHMGKAHVSCSGGCSCPEFDIDGHRSAKQSVPSLQDFFVYAKEGSKDEGCDVQARFAADRGQMITIVSAYSPTEAASDEEAGDFYLRVTALADKANDKRYLLIVAGGSQRRAWDSSQLRRPAVRREFNLQLSDRFGLLEAVPPEGADAQAEYDAMAAAIREVATNHLAPRGSRRRRGWQFTLSQRTLRLMDARQRAHTAWLRSKSAAAKRERNRANRAADAAVHTDRERWIGQQVAEAQDMLRKKNLRQFARACDRLAGRSRSHQIPPAMRDVSGALHSGPDGVLKAMTESFDKLYGGETKLSNETLNQLENDVAAFELTRATEVDEAHGRPPDLAETEACVRALRSAAAPGGDQLDAMLCWLVVTVSEDSSSPGKEHKVKVIGITTSATGVWKIEDIFHRADSPLRRHRH
ncbi:hypothetical protein FOA52_016031 [Chlamydomonas sp. UWO 241]|nr:hypothetical protein FOA52_016031 [Chlamydomonas sp. UWO 241]